MTERWRTEPLVGRRDGFQNLVDLQPIYHEIEDTGSADSVNTVRHGLGRVPRSVDIVNCELASAGDLTWYRLTTDTDWDTVELGLRFRVANARVLLRIQ